MTTTANLFTPGRTALVKVRITQYENIETNKESDERVFMVNIPYKTNEIPAKLAATTFLGSICHLSNEEIACISKEVNKPTNNCFVPLYSSNGVFNSGNKKDMVEIDIPGYYLRFEPMNLED